MEIGWQFEEHTDLRSKPIVSLHSGLWLWIALYVSTDVSCVYSASYFRVNDNLYTKLQVIS